MPNRRRRTSGKGRVIFIVIVLVLFALALSLRGIAGFWTDYLWFESLDLTSVFTGILGAKIALAVIFTAAFFVLCFVSLTVADRLAPKFRPQGPEDDLLDKYHATVGRRAGLLRAGVSLLLGLVAGVGMSSEWTQWLLFRNGGDFGITDATFDTDVGFYVFKLPFYSTIVSWLFASGVIILIVTVVAHYLNGGIRLQAPVQRVTPQVKAHISVLLGLLALVKAADYWLQRYELTTSTRGTVNGATYTDVNAQLPAIYLLLFIAVLSFFLFIYNIWRRGWVLPVVAVGLWALVSVVAGVAYPTFIQRFTVEPAESGVEAPYIANNIEATRQAFGLDQVTTEPFDYTQDQAAGTAAVTENPGTIRNIRLLDPEIVLPTYQRLQSQVALVPVQRARRRPLPGAVPRRHLRRDPGGARRSRPERRTASPSSRGRAATWPTPTATAWPWRRPTPPPPRVGPSSWSRTCRPSSRRPTRSTSPSTARRCTTARRCPGYAITNADREEIDFSVGGQTQSTVYDGTGGVVMDSWLKKAAFAARFADWNLLISNFVTPESRIVFQRDVQERVREIAPFLSFDSDPYPVLTNGRIVYIFDAYTTSGRYPNAQQADTGNIPQVGGLSGQRFNYVRNSIKGVVDTYDGTVDLYVIDDGDPIAQAYQKAFPELLQNGDDFPEELRAHWRFPEDLFRVQTNAWSRYHIDAPAEFYERNTAWLVAQDPGSAPTGVTGGTTQIIPGQGVVRTRESRIDPYYMLLKLPGEDREKFVSLRPFVPFSEDDSRRVLTAFMVASSDPEDYGKITVFQMPDGTNIDGPSIANANILANQVVSQRISLLNTQGSQVRLGNMLLVPVNNSILYVRPFYVASDNTAQVPELREVIVVFGQQVIMRPTLNEALKVLFPGADPQTFEDLQSESLVTPEPVPIDPLNPPTTTPPSTGDETIAELLAQAAALLTSAESDLRATGDLGAYQDAVTQAAELLARAQELSGVTGAESAPPSTVPPETTTTAPQATTTSATRSGLGSGAVRIPAGFLASG